MAENEDTSQQAPKKRDRLSLDVRRQDVLSLLVKGLTYPQIAKELGISTQAVYRDVKWLRSSKRVDIELIRVFNWHAIMRLLPKLELYQEARLRIDVQRILEPKQIKQELQASGELRFILEAWRPADEEDEDNNDPS